MPLDLAGQKTVLDETNAVQRRVPKRSPALGDCELAIPQSVIEHKRRSTANEWPRQGQGPVTRTGFAGRPIDKDELSLPIAKQDLDTLRKRVTGGIETFDALPGYRRDDDDDRFTKPSCCQ